MKIYKCLHCDTVWADIYLVDENKCKVCGNVCSELIPVEKSPELFRKRTQTLDEFLNDINVNQATLDARRRCNADGHKPYVDDGQGGNGCINGCYCGWITLNHPANFKSPSSWSDLEH